MKLLISILLFTFYHTSIFSQQWSIMGDSTVSAGDGDESWITVDNNGISYVVFRDGYIHLGATVKKFDGSHWITVGVEGFSVNSGTGWDHCNSIAFDNMNTPYVAFQDEQNNFKATVMKFDGTNWVYVGMKGFSPDHAAYQSIAIDKNGTPFVAFADRDSTVIGGSMASVMKFDGTNWVYVGSRRFSAGEAIYTSLALDKDGNPYVAYWDMSDIWNQPPYKAAVMKFDGTNWVNVGVPGFAAWSAYNQALVFDSKNTPYLACSIAGKSAVMKFDGTNWVAVGSQAGMGGECIAIDKNDIPYVAYADAANGKANVMKFDGANWINVGNPDFSPSDCFYLTLALDTNGNIYVAFKDGTPHYHSNSQYPYYPEVAMKFQDNSSGINEMKNNSSLTVYPNPTAGVFQINYSAAEKGSLQLNIIDAKGKTVYSETIVRFNGEYKKEIDLGRKAKGVYFVEMILGNPSSQGYEGRVEKRTKKIILE